MGDKKHPMKDHILKHSKLWSFVLLLLAAWIISSGMERARADALQKSISGKVLRFHVLANSDRDADQQIKLAVRDEVLRWLEIQLAEAGYEDKETGSKYSAKQMELEGVEKQIEKLLPKIEQTSERILKRAGFTYGARAELKEVYFPKRTYGNYTFPEGNYKALRILLGEAGGENWWCVLFPKLCFLDCVHAVFPEESQEQLRGILTEEEYESLFDPQKDAYRICFKYF